jgi:transcriptional regulator with XRE-family HTH domain
MLTFLAELRNKLNCSQPDFGRLFETSSTTISRVENTFDVLHHRWNASIQIISDRIDEVDARLAAGELPQNLPDASHLETIVSRNTEIAIAIHKLEGELKSTVDRFETAQKAKLYIENIILNPDSISEDQLFWTRSQMRKQEFILEKSSLLVQHKLKIRIAQLQLERELNEAFLGGADDVAG